MNPNQQLNSAMWTAPQLHALLHHLLEAVNDAVTVVDTAGVVLYWSRQAEAMYGITQSTIIGRKIADFFQRESIMLFQVMESGSAIRQLYHEPRPGVHVMINAEPITDHEGNLLGAVSLESNMTSYVKLSAEMYRKADTEKMTSASYPFKPELLKRARLVVEKNRQVLLVGEIGTGKRNAAEWIYEQLQLSGLFVTISCGSVPEGLLEAELFGYQGEVERQGKLDQAADGILYIKDAEHLPHPVQEKLHEMIISGSFTRLSGTRAIPYSCRIIAASTCDGNIASEWLPELYYMFVQHLMLPVRERVEELPELCSLFLGEAADKYGIAQLALQPDAMAQIAAYDWPDNLPQLRSALEQAALAAHEAGAAGISARELPDYARLTTLAELTEDELPLSVHSSEMERSRITDALKRAQGNKARAARLLGISRGALYYKLRQYELE